ncbi:hypothetical protein E2I00_009497, partial [Balaenoptera physalus]
GGGNCLRPPALGLAGPPPRLSAPAAPPEQRQLTQLQAARLLSAHHLGAGSWGGQPMEPGLLRPAPVSEVIVLHYNYTGKLRGARYQPGAGLRADAVVCLAVCALIVLENLAVLIVLGRHPRFHAPMFLLLGSLTLSDLLAGAAYAANILLSGPLTLRLSPALWFAREGGVFVALAASADPFLGLAMANSLLNPIIY